MTADELRLAVTPGDLARLEAALDAYMVGAGPEDPPSMEALAGHLLRGLLYAAALWRSGHREAAEAKLGRLLESIGGQP